MIELEKIPHIHEISNHGPYHGAREKNTATFQARSTRQNKLVPSLEEAIRRTGLKDGMTISFHHHFRNGDHIINTVVDKLAEMGYKNLTLAASSLAAVHAPLIRHIQNGVITHIETSGMRGELAEQVSRGLIDCPVVFRSHGGRASAIRSGDLHIDVAFLGAPSCDPYGNANGYSRDDEDGIACGSLGYARTDATYADNVIVIDTVSKRFSACGARIGCMISRNKELMAQAMKYAQCRLSVPTLDQIASAALYTVGPEYFAAVRDEYKLRRDTVMRKLKEIPGVVCECPRGAFYVMAALPVDDADKFQMFLLEEFDDHGDTVMFAPGEPFYATPGKGKNEIRIAYVLKQQDLERAMDLLALGIRAYQQR